ncbi:PREDICTED: uncharacterized protein LOC109147138 [Ipomoea nil]|uniref:uncharacterized protein LOC109147138 n=1 Tax=Ipomoea nil TaxID=35883 RepID=UPI0009018531|nr:PREDICTED: uncharacterized protein LOC109147138 [Ipomoea nil]
MGRNPPSYLGQEDPEILESWIRTFDKLFDVVNCPEDQRVETTVYYLQEEADHWWVMEGPTLKEKEDFDWEMFKVTLRGRFNPEHVKAVKYEEFLHFEQGSIKACKFVHGLHYDAQKLFTAAKFATLNESYDAAAGRSRIQQLHRIALHGPKKMSEGNNSQSSKVQRFNPVVRNDNRNGEMRNPVVGQGVGARGLFSVRNVACPRCGKDHPRTTCGGGSVTCFNCGKPGHRAAVCWYPKMERSHSTTPSQQPRGQFNQAPNRGMGRGN